MHKRFVRGITALGGIIAGAAVCVFWAEPALAAKVDLNPSPINLVEGASQIVQITLNNPIICSPGPSCGVDLPIVASDPSRVIISPSTVHFDATQWAQVKTFTITAVADGVHNASNTVTLDTTAVSAAVYYNNFHTSVTLNLTDLDPAPTPTPSPMPSQPKVLPAVGASDYALSMMALIGAVIGGIATWLYSRPSSFKP